MLPAKLHKIAIIGAGPSGLAVAKALKADFRIKVLEQANDVGGTWLYTEHPEHSTSVHCSLYRSLRTLVPREVMQFSDFPFSDDLTPLRYPHHSAVLKYLQAYANQFDLRRLITFGRSVFKVSPTGVGAAGQPTGWAVQHRPTDTTGPGTTERFDGVVVCTGHYSEPLIPNIPGSDTFPGPRRHSHGYREPSAYAGQRVLLIGASNSGQDISREVADVADAVFLSARGFPDATVPGGEGPYGRRRNIFRVPEVAAMRPDGTVVFTPAVVDGGGPGGGSLAVDSVLYCTGYHYSFPFLDTKYFSITENWVSPLYKHMLPVSAPNLAFVCLLGKIIPFPQAELQAQYIRAVWSGRVALPSVEEMERDVMRWVAAKRAKGAPIRHWNYQGSDQYPYNEELARLAGCPPPPAWRKAMHEASTRNRTLHPDRFRDMKIPTIAECEAAAAALASRAAAAAGTATEA